MQYIIECMPLLLNYLKILFYWFECQFHKILNIKCREFQLILQMIAMKINLTTYNNDLPAIGNKNCALQKPFETDFLSVIGNAKLRPSFVICWVAQGSRPRCGPRHPILQSNIFLFRKIICINYFIVKFI